MVRSNLCIAVNQHQIFMILLGNNLMRTSVKMYEEKHLWCILPQILDIYFELYVQQRLYGLLDVTTHH